ncbi:MAG: GNAT family N-acetyltransferase [Pseudomonadota bacterium]
MIDDINPEHHAEILRLNETFVHWLSPLDEAGLIALLGHASYARQVAGGQAFLIGYDGNSTYRHKNVDWLSARFESYAYVDRIVVDPSLAGQSVARQLYADFERWAGAQGLGWIGCEVNTVPDHPASHAFHVRLGFRPLDDVRYGDKAVRYYAKPLTPIS